MLFKLGRRHFCRNMCQGGIWWGGQRGQEVPELLPASIMNPSGHESFEFLVGDELAHLSGTTGKVGQLKCNLSTMRF